MYTKRAFIIATALLMASQAYALTAAHKNIGCNNEIGDCRSELSGTGGGGGSGAEYVGAYTNGGSLWEDFYDKNGNFSIETNLTSGKKSVHFEGKSAFLIKPPPASSAMKRSALAYGPLVPAQLTPAAAKQKAADAAAAKAKAEADKKAAEAKAFQEKMAAEDAAYNKAQADKAKAAAVHTRPIINTAPGAKAALSTDRTKP